MAPHTLEPMSLPAFAQTPWQMSYGERAAFEGILSQVKPRLAVEIGTAQGGSLQRVAAHSDEVHSFDLVAPPDEVADLENVTFHTGDSHQLVNDYLHHAADRRRSVDFVLIDGDHSADGVRRDIVDVLGSDAVTGTVIVLHDTLNPEVRRGIEAAGIADHPKVALFELDLVPGYLARREPYRLQMWGGLGVIVVDAEHRRQFPDSVRDTRFHELFGVIRPTVDVMAAIEARGVALDGLSGDQVESEIQVRLTRPGDGSTMSTSDAAVSAELQRAIAEEARLAARLKAIEGSRGWRLVLVYRELGKIFRGRH